LSGLQGYQRYPLRVVSYVSTKAAVMICKVNLNNVMMVLIRACGHQLISRVRLRLEFVVLFQHDTPDMIVQT